METYLRRWDRDHAQGDQAGRVERIFQPVFAGIVSTTKLSLLGKLLIEISAMISLETQLKMVKGTPALGFRCMAWGVSERSVYGTGKQGNQAVGSHYGFYQETLYIDNWRNGRVKRKTIVFSFVRG